MKKRKVKKSKKRIVVKLGTNLLTKNNNQLDGFDSKKYFNQIALS